MLTVGLAWIKAKYDADYSLMFLVTFLLDVSIISNVGFMLTK